ncbi:hypothetical protein B0T21DRAFT_366595 [Apiosordaria backusii]|uniref:Uncharacterized protein n=1 Tax=Apiosordaria backusii TaxID=314023 RepID=A0AA40EHM5_9PEZI|nr:hypothetical protein B0T21DRAFT_366595 [Apiosordaria backusii]
MEYDPFNPNQQPKNGPEVAVTEAYTFNQLPEKNEPGITRTQTWWRAWWLEVLAMVTSIGCSVAIIAILSRFNGRPITDWTDKSTLAEIISLPTTLSILATATSATTTLVLGSAISQYKWVYFKTKTRSLADLDLLDGTSRGTIWICVELLLKRTRTLASLGAIAMILSLAVGPFLQQTVQLVSWDVPTDDGKAKFGLAHEYIAGGRKNTAASGVDPSSKIPDIYYCEPATADVLMQGAVYRGLYKLESPAKFECTSNCTWPDTQPYVSLGFSSSCTDVADATLRAAKWNVSSTDGVNKTLTTPGGVVLDASFSWTSYQPVVIVGSRHLLTNDDLMAPSFARIAILRAGVDMRSYNMSIKPIEITECDISLAAYRYTNISVSNGHFSFGKQELIRLEPGLLDPDTDTNATIRMPTVAFATAPDGKSVNLKVATADIGALAILFISRRFIGTLYAGESPPSQPQGVGDAFRAGDIAKTVENMAQSMTDQLRANFQVEAKGISVYSIVHYSVEWPWLALPLAVQLISLVFFLWVLVRNHRSALQHWKDSALAIIGHSLQAVDEDIHRVEMVGPMHVEKFEDLTDWAKQTKAKLL